MMRFSLIPRLIRFAGNSGVFLIFVRDLYACVEMEHQDIIVGVMHSSLEKSWGEWCTASRGSLGEVHLEGKAG